MYRIKKIIKKIYDKIFYEDSPGVISRNNAVQKMDQYLEVYIDYLAITGPFLKIGHRAGDYKRYPQNNRAIIENQVFHIKDMLDDCFNYLKLDGVEIDLQLDNKKIIAAQEDIYIIHDSIEGNFHSQSKQYLLKNSFSSILEYFIKKKYYKSKYLYLEVKTARANQFAKDGKDEKLAEKIFMVINDTIRKLKLSIEEIKILKEHLFFWSFNYRILEKMDMLQKKDKNKERYALYLIVATNKFIIGNIIKFLPSLRSMNYLNNKLYKKVLTSKFLDGICFDPATISDFSVYFNKLNNGREQNSLKRLNYIISEYKLKKNDFFKKIYSQKEKIKESEGIIFEFDSER